MSLSRIEALEVMGLEPGASDKDIKDRFKQLALKWHPDKNPENPKAAEEKFQKLSAAYSNLKHQDKEDKEEDTYDAVSLAELLIEIFGRRRFMYEPQPPSPYCNCFYCMLNSEWRNDREEMMEAEKKKEYIRDYHEATAKVIGDHLVKQFADKLYNNFNQPTRTNKKGSGSLFKSQVKLSSEEASHNAEQLLEAEEKDKKEREKKRERNKKKKEAKKKKKANAAKTPVDKPIATAQAEESESEESAEDELDVTSAFIARANKKQSSTTTKPRFSLSNDPPPYTSNGTVNSTTSLHSSEGDEDQYPPPTQDSETMENNLGHSRKLASLGNRAAKDGHFGEAVRRYSEAIAFYPYDHRYFGNRSYCYDFLCNYTSALTDANKAIELDITWAKGYYRQGRAYAGLKMLELAEGSYILALKYDPQYTEVQEELVKIRVDQLVGMGFPIEQCEPAVKEFGTVQACIDAILAGKVMTTPTVSDGYFESSVPAPNPPPTKLSRERFTLPPRMQARANQPPSPPSPPRKEKSRAAPAPDKKSLWIGNLTSDDITEDMLTDIFQQYGDLTSVKLLVHRHCAFINYQNASSAAEALKHLQGYHLGGNYLLLRFPETSNKNPYMMNLKKPGPVNGTECYYWRTTGCSFGAKCRYDHLPNSKEIDLPAMM